MPPYSLMSEQGSNHPNPRTSMRLSGYLSLLPSTHAGASMAHIIISDSWHTKITPHMLNNNIVNLLNVKIMKVE